MLTNYWYIGCASLKLGDAAPVAARILDRDVVLFRDGKGAPVALADQCCHRGLALSRGKVAGDRIACGFHGWKFDATGACVEIPSLEPGQPIKDFYRVPSYAALEKDGYVWVWIGDRKPDYAPAIPQFADGRWSQGSVAMECASLRAIEINLDSSHVRFVHPSHPYTIEVTRKGGAFETIAHGLAVTDTGMKMTFDQADAGSIAFDLPDRVLLASEVPHFGTVYIIMHVVPTGPRTCRLEYLMTQFDPTQTAKVSWEEEVPQIFAEDKVVLENIQKAYDAHGTEFERSVEGDATPLLARQVVKLAEKGKWPGERSSLPMQRTIRLRM